MKLLGGFEIHSKWTIVAQVVLLLFVRLFVLNCFLKDKSCLSFSEWNLEGKIRKGLN